MSIFIPDPYFFLSRIPDPTNNNPTIVKEKKITIVQILHAKPEGSHHLHKIENFLKRQRERSEITDKKCKYYRTVFAWIRDTGSEIGIQDRGPVPGPGVKKAPDPGSGTVVTGITYGKHAFPSCGRGAGAN